MTDCTIPEWKSSLPALFDAKVGHDLCLDPRDGRLAAGSIVWQYGWCLSCMALESGDQGCYYCEKALLHAATSERGGPPLVSSKPVIELSARCRKCL